MIVAAWLRWKEDRRTRWLVLGASILVADLLVGPAIIAWEIAVLKDAFGR